MDTKGIKSAMFFAAIGTAGTMLLAVVPAGGQTNPWAPLQTTVPLSVEVLPIAEIQFPEGVNGLHLYVPPANSTIPDTGLHFKVRGNALAWVRAQPDEFMLIQSYYVGNTNVGPRYLGKGELPGGGTIGYNIQVEFPVGIFANLNIVAGQPTPANPVDMVAAGGEVDGFLHLLASHRWTADGTMPGVGDYLGDILVTVGADPL